MARSSGPLVTSFARRRNGDKSSIFEVSMRLPRKTTTAHPVGSGRGHSDWCKRKLKFSCSHCGPRAITSNYLGDENPKVMIIGIAPGTDEWNGIKRKLEGEVTFWLDRQPFIGPAGRLLDRLLVTGNWQRDKCVLTNLICWLNDEPSKEDIANCSQRLAAEIEYYKPKLIITLGAIACEALIDEKLGNARGAVLWRTIHSHECYIMATYHPAAILHGSSYFAKEILIDFRKIPSILATRPKGLDGNVNWKLVESYQEAVDILSSFTPGQHLSLDVETGAPEEEEDPFIHPLLCFCISTGDMTWVFPCEDGQDWVASALKGLWENLAVTCRWSGWSFGGDKQVILRKLGINLPISDDGMFQLYSLYEGVDPQAPITRRGVFRLKSRAREVVYGADFWERPIEKYYGHMQTAPKDILYKYNAQDGAYTHRYIEHRRAEQDEDNVTDLYRSLLIPTANAFSEINYAGIPVDLARLKQLGVDWIPRYIAAEKRLQDQAAEAGYYKKAMNLNSPKQLNEFLYDILELPLFDDPKTRTKIRTTRKEALVNLVGEHEFIDELMAFKQLSHMLDNYVVPMPGYVREDGAVHPTTFLHGTVTGRCSYRMPPMQTIPKDSKVGEDLARIREIFVAPNDDEVLVELDHTQIEVWVGAFLSGDPQMFDDLCSGDYHRRAAAGVFTKQPEDITEQERDDSKYVTFGIMFGRGEDSLAARELKQLTGGNPRIAKRYMLQFLKRYFVYADWIHQQHRLMVKEGEVVSPTGRKRRMPIVHGPEAHKALRQAVNAPIQSTAGDYIFDAIIELHTAFNTTPYFSGNRILLSVHDSILFLLKRRTLDTVLPFIVNTMTKPRFGLPGVGVDLKMGQNWGKKTDANPNGMEKWPMPKTMALWHPETSSRMKLVA